MLRPCGCGRALAQTLKTARVGVPSLLYAARCVQRAATASSTAFR